MFSSVDVLEQDAEFVAAEASACVTATGACREALGKGDEQAIAGLVPEAVVDRLEVVDVEEEHRDRLRLAASPLERVLDAIGKERTVGQAGKRIVKGLELELLLERGAAGDVVNREDDSADGGIV